jgi:hypothetical protein
MAFYLEGEEWFMGKKRRREKNDTLHGEIAFNFLLSTLKVYFIRWRSRVFFSYTYILVEKSN